MAQPHAPVTERRDSLFTWDQHGLWPEQRARVSVQQRQEHGSVTTLGPVSEGRPLRFSGERRSEPDRNLLQALGFCRGGRRGGPGKRGGPCPCRLRVSSGLFGALITEFQSQAIPEGSESFAK